MARMMTWLMIIVSLMLVMNLAGLQTNTGYVLGKLGVTDSSHNFNLTSFYIALLAAITAVVGSAGIKIGLLGSSWDVGTTAKATFAVAVLFLFLDDMISVITYTKGLECVAGAICSSWVFWIILLIMIITSIGFLISIMDWVGGND